MSFKHINIRHRRPVKKKYHVKNWPEYNQGLINRGGIMFMLMEDITEEWYSTPAKRSPGGKEIYSDYAIEFCLQIRYLLKMPLRQTQGFLIGLFCRMGIDLKVPNYSALSIRATNLNIEIKRFTKEEENNRIEEGCVIVDSTGMKIYGEGEWSGEKHNTKTRKAWRKLHIAIDGNGNILASTLTKNNIDDGTEIPNLMKDINGDITTFLGDGAYDNAPTHEFLECKYPEIQVITPPRKDAKFSRLVDTSPTQRDRHLKTILEKGRVHWQHESGYGRRSMVENSMYRIKTIYGGKLKSRNIENQKAETRIVLNNINIMTALGMPESYAVNV